MKIELTPILDNGNPNPKDVTFQRISEGDTDVLRITIREPSGADRDIDFSPQEVEKTMTALRHRRLRPWTDRTSMFGPGVRSPT